MNKEQFKTRQVFRTLYFDIELKEDYEGICANFACSEEGYSTFDLVDKKDIPICEACDEKLFFKTKTVTFGNGSGRTSIVSFDPGEDKSDFFKDTFCPGKECEHAKVRKDK